MILDISGCSKKIISVEKIPGKRSAYCNRHERRHTMQCADRRGESYQSQKRTFFSAVFISNKPQSPESAAVQNCRR